MTTGSDKHADKMRMKKNVCAVRVLVTYTVLQPSCCQIPPLPGVTYEESGTPRWIEGVVALHFFPVSDRDLERRPGLEPHHLLPYLASRPKMSLCLFEVRRYIFGRTGNHTFGTPPAPDTMATQLLRTRFLMHRCGIQRAQTGVQHVNK